MEPSENRRRLLAALGAGAFTVAAGCTDGLSDDADGDGGETDGDEDEAEAFEDEGEDVEEEEEGYTGTVALEWSTESDWADAQGRTGVVSSALGGRDPDTLSLGYDPASEPVSELDSFWPLDEDDPDADTFADLFGDADLVHDPERWEFSDEIDPSAPGLFGGTSVEFDGEDAIVHDGLPVDPSEDWTMGVWVWLDDPEDLSCAMMMESPGGPDPDDEGEALGILPSNAPPAFKIGSVNNTPGHGSEFNTQEWHFHVIRYQADHNLVEGYFDGEEDYPVQPEDGEEWIPGLQDLTLGLRRSGSNDYVFDGRLDAAWMTQGLVSEDDIRRLYEAAFEGRLITAAQSADGEAVGLEVTAEVPVETAASVTVHQDTNGDGESDLSQTVNLNDDTESYGLDGFEESEGSDYWVEVALQTGDPEVTPRIGSVGLAFDEDEGAEDESGEEAENGNEAENGSEDEDGEQ
jgi:hypothetical protein